MHISPFLFPSTHKQKNVGFNGSRSSFAESTEVIGELTKCTGSSWFFVFMLLPLPFLLLSLPLSWFRRCCKLAPIYRGGRFIMSVLLSVACVSRSQVCRVGVACRGPRCVVSCNWRFWVCLTKAVVVRLRRRNGVMV